MKIAINEITIDPAVAIRQGTDEDTIQRYMDTFEELPPIVVFHTDHQYLLADGFHRWAAASRLGHTDIESDVREGSYEEATEYAIYANLKHGKPLNTQEYHYAVRRLKLLHPDWGTPRIGKAISRSDEFVSRVLKSDAVINSTTVELPYRVASEIATAPKELWDDIATTAKEQGWTVEQTANVVAILKTQPNKLEEITGIPKSQLSQTLDATLARINHKTQEVITAIEPEIKIETPDDLRQAAKTLYKEAKRKAKETMTLEEKQEQETKRTEVKAEREARAKEKAGVIPLDVRLAIIEEAIDQNPELVKRAVSRKKLRDEQLHQHSISERTCVDSRNGHRCDILLGDITTWEEQLSFGIKAGEVDAVITDPPYAKGYIPLLNHLATFSTFVLKDGGSLFVMMGQSYLPDVIISLSSAGLTYHWTLAYLTPGGQSPQLWDRKVNSFWKPVLWFVKGQYTGKWLGDVVKSEVNDNDKDFHKWGQSESGMANLIERATEDGDLILDPFMGGGTTGKVANLLGRGFIGIDNSNESINLASRRIGITN